MSWLSYQTIARLKNTFSGKYYYPEPKHSSTTTNKIEHFKNQPLISILLPTYNVERKWLEKAIQSVQKQWYRKWELCIVDDASTNPETIKYLKSIQHPNIRIHFLRKNLNISAASNQALSLAQGDFIALMDHDDELTPNALYEVVKAINETGAEFIYSDEDKLHTNGSYCCPHFKPGFAPDYFLTTNYLSHFGVIKKDLMEKVGGFSRDVEGAQDYDLYLKVVEYTNKITHIPKVLYHWRKIPGSTASSFGEKSYANEAGRLALERAMTRRKIKAVVEFSSSPGLYRIKYEIIGQPLVSIIIPFKDQPELLRSCIESILQKSTYPHYEVIGISNNSEDQATVDEMQRLSALDSRIHFYEYNEAFNYSAINNHAVKKYAQGEQLLLLNNDIEIITPDWIEELLRFSQRENTGAVGAKLYYPNNTVQHAGIFIGLGDFAAHFYRGAKRNRLGYSQRLKITQNFSAVTGACLMVKKTLYDQLGGLNETDLKIAYNDVDFCLRLCEAGFVNVFTPFCEAYHHESVSRGQDNTKEKQIRYQSEVSYMRTRHKDIFLNGDPYYNKNIKKWKKILHKQI